VGYCCIIAIAIIAVNRSTLLSFSGTKAHATNKFGKKSLIASSSDIV